MALLSGYEQVELRELEGREEDLLELHTAYVSNYFQSELTFNKDEIQIARESVEKIEEPLSRLHRLRKKTGFSPFYLPE